MEQRYPLETVQLVGDNTIARATKKVVRAMLVNQYVISRTPKQFDGKQEKILFFILYSAFFIVTLQMGIIKKKSIMEARTRRRRATRPISHYWEMVKDLDDSQKLQLVTMLVSSVKPAKVEPKKKYTADDFAGMWSDEYFMDVDELNKLIRDGRHVKSNRDRIWDEV